MGVPLNIDWQQILLHLFNFVLLAGGLYFLLYKPVKRFMDKRAAYFASLEADAKDKEENARKLEAEYREKLSDADAEILKQRAAAQAAAEKEAGAILAEAKKQKEKILADARDAGRREKDKMIEDARGEIAALAVEATAKLLRDSEAGGEARHA